MYNSNAQLNFFQDDIERKEPLRFSPPTELQKLISDLDSPVSQMAAKTEGETEYYKMIKGAQRRTTGMDNVPIDLFNQLIVHLAKKNKYRDAMVFILQANYGMRYSDLARLRFCHIFNCDGTFKEAFTLPNGELKTSKQNIYYNNRATKYIVKLYLAQNPQVQMYDFIFPAVGNRKSKQTVYETEVEELYGYDIKRFKKRLRAAENDKEKHKTAYINGKITADEYKSIAEDDTAKIAEIKSIIGELQNGAESYISLSPDANKQIAKSITHEGISVILKNALKEIGANPLNCKNGTPNIDLKLCTHSFRKTFGNQFYDRAYELKKSGVKELQYLDTTIMKLLQDKYMHSDSSITRCYSDIEERAFKAVCTNLDIGFTALLEATGVAE